MHIHKDGTNKEKFVGVIAAWEQENTDGHFWTYFVEEQNGPGPEERDMVYVDLVNTPLSLVDTFVDHMVRHYPSPYDRPVIFGLVVDSKQFSKAEETALARRGIILLLQQFGVPRLFDGCEACANFAKEQKAAPERYAHVFENDDDYRDVD